MQLEKTRQQLYYTIEGETVWVLAIWSTVTGQPPRLRCRAFPDLARSASTAIYFLLRRGDFSAFHLVRSDEVWHHYLGAPLELHPFDPNGTPNGATRLATFNE